MSKWRYWKILVADYYNLREYKTRIPSRSFFSKFLSRELPASKQKWEDSYEFWKKLWAGQIGGEPILGVKVLRGWRRPNGQSGRANTSSLLMSQTHSDDLKSDKCFLLISFGHSGCQFLNSDWIFISFISSNLGLTEGVEGVEAVVGQISWVTRGVEPLRPGEKQTFFHQPWF